MYCAGLKMYVGLRRRGVGIIVLRCVDAFMDLVAKGAVDRVVDIGALDVFMRV